MKSNLKTLWNAIENGYVATVEELKRFEKELREMRDNPKLGFTPCYLTLHTVIKEILGDA